MSEANSRPTKARKRPLKPALLRRPRAARFCDVSAPTWDRLDASGKIPAGKKLGGCKVWSRRELLAWIDAGMPDRDTWETIKRETKGR